MITARPQKNAKVAKQYFSQHLAKGDYYSENQTVQGWWFGQGAQRLGLDLAAPVNQTAYERLCDNLNPVSGEKLTVRQRQVDRRICYDFVVSAPKSVSIMALTIGDKRLITAHSEACVTAMMKMEQVAAARVRRGGQDGARLTGEIVAAVFRHDSSRALDPQLHTHFVMFNATYDKEEARWKALETTRMFDQMSLFTEIYRYELATRMLDLGYGLRSTANGFEIEGVTPKIIYQFSKRRRAIQAEEARLTEKLGKPLSNNARATVAHQSRPRKDTSLSSEQVLAHQLTQLSNEELETLRQLVPSGTPPAIAAPTVSAAEAINYAREHVFERHSVIEVHKLLEVAMVYARYAVPLADLESELAARPEFIAVEDQLTTKEMLEKEQRLVSLVNQGTEKLGPMNPSYQGNSELTGEQRQVLKLILRSPDQVIGLRGGAGTGKTTLLHEVIRGIEERQKTVVLAPTTAAVEALRKEGLRGTATVQRFLGDEKFQQDAKTSVMVVDEAGLLSTRDLLALVEWSQGHRGRLVLSGDTRQHTSVEAGDALRLLESRSTLRMVGVHTIKRQVNHEYREAITELAQGKGLEGLTRLEKIGGVCEMNGPERYQCLAGDYLASIKAGKSALIVSPTWREIRQVTAEVRDRLKTEGLLSVEETEVNAHHGLKWTQAQKRDLRNYKPGLVISFIKGTTQFNPGDWAEVVEVGSDAMQVRTPNGRRIEVTKKQAGCFNVAEPLKMPVAPGEQLLIQGNRKTDGLFNGQFVTVKRVKPNGGILLDDGRSLAPDFRSFTYGYCVTSYAAQARTVDHVYVAVDSHSLQAASLNQFYVSASRGRKQVKVYTDDLMFLRRAVTRPAARLSATELVQRSGVAHREDVEQRLALKERMIA